MNILLIGSGVIGSIYGGHLALAGHRVWVLEHGNREKEIERNGIQLYHIEDKKNETAKVSLTKNADDKEYDLVLIAVNANQLSSTFSTLRQLKGNPLITILGNNPEGHRILPHDLPGTVILAFPGFAGSINNDIVHYVPIPQQPTTFEKLSSPTGKILIEILSQQGFPVHTTEYMEGWLAYHAMFISCISIAIIKSHGDTLKLGHNQKLLYEMCLAIEEGFRLLKTQHIAGLPTNLAILHYPLFRPLAVSYWGNMMRSPKGKLYFASHIKHSPDEITILKNWVIQHCSHDTANTRHLRNFLN